MTTKTESGSAMKCLGFAMLLLVYLFGSAPAYADVGGTVPAPGLCDYPGVGSSGMAMNSYWYTCDFPIEENGSHWHCEYGGGSVVATAGVSIMMFNAGIAGNVGVITGTCSWRCPDLTLAAPPNPPGAWKNRITPVKCVAVGGVPPSPLGMSDGVHDDPQPAVTSPLPGNPLETQNPK